MGVFKKDKKEKVAELYREALKDLEKFGGDYTKGTILRKLHKAFELEPENKDIAYSLGKAYMMKAEVQNSSNLPYAGKYLKKAMDLGCPEAARDYFKSGDWERSGRSMLRWTALPTPMQRTTPQVIWARWNTPSARRFGMIKKKNIGRNMRRS